MARNPDISPLSVALSRVDAAADGAPARDTVASGFPSLDKMLGGGFRRGDLIVLGGDVGSGKSALALAIALRAAVHHRTVFVSGEMLPERIHERALAIEGRARVDDLRRGSLSDATRAQVGAAAVRLRDRLPVIERASHGGVADLAPMLDGLPDTELLVVDQIEGLGSTDRAMAEEAAITIKALKALALERRVAILATSQLPNLGDREDRRPTLDDFGGMGATKQYADVVLGLYREELYAQARDITGATELFVRKNRNGRTGYVDLYFYAQWLRFEDMLDPDL
ncbi:MAG TPA: DnaB-like helicase C-terminal domain-containing protein [Gemmatimonadaceae bacterium]|nr:DnaB-like helicase C-terminal domain-containing protein [Gemmatimonadaceae bacterium]